MPAETHRASSALSRDEIRELVADIVAEMTGSISSTPQASDRLVDLGVDDLTLLAVVEALEHELGERTVGLSVDDDDLAELRTIDDIVAVVCARCGATESGR